MDDTYANVEKPLDNRSKRQWADKKGEDIYTNNDVITFHSTPSPNTAVTKDTAPSKALRCLGLLCLFLLVGIVGLLCVHFTRDEWKAELAQLKISYTNLSDARDQLKTAYTNLSDERDQLKTAYTNLSVESDQLLDRHDILKKQYEKLQMCHVNGGCKNCWTMFGNSCYYISTEKKDWEGSRKYCQERGAHLVIINSQEEQKFVVSHNKSVWIGLTDRDKERVWKWVDGAPLIESFWSLKQPDNYKEEDCVENYNYNNSPELLDKWNDISCSHANLFICEMNI